MQQYRLFFLGAGGQFEHSREFEAEDDVTAIRISEGWRTEGRRMELWQRHRRVKVCDRS